MNRRVHRMSAVIASLCLWVWVLSLNEVPACRAMAPNPSSNRTPLEVEAIRTQLPPFDWEPAAPQPDIIETYRRHYGLDFQNARHFMGHFESAGMQIAAQVFLPSNPGGTFFLAHGYFDHAGTLRHLIEQCLARGFAVAVYDLPGHGLSSGERGAIEDFAQYVSVLKDFLAICAGHLPGPFHLVAHSTGCAIVFEYLHHGGERAFEKIVFLAPLVRHAHWHLSSIGYRLVKPFADTLPRANRRNSSDDQFLAFARQDPLRNAHLHLSFMDALHAWYRRIQDYVPLSQQILAIQGSDDAIVDWPYNLEFLHSKFIGLTVEQVDNARHQLVNESRTLRQRVFERIFVYVAEPTDPQHALEQEEP